MHRSLGSRPWEIFSRVHGRRSGSCGSDLSTSGRLSGSPATPAAPDVRNTGAFSFCPPCAAVDKLHEMGRHTACYTSSLLFAHVSSHCQRENDLLIFRNRSSVFAKPGYCLKNFLLQYDAANLFLWVYACAFPFRSACRTFWSWSHRCFAASKPMVVRSGPVLKFFCMCLSHRLADQGFFFLGWASCLLSSAIPFPSCRGGACEP